MEHMDTLAFLRDHTKQLRQTTHKLEVAMLSRLRSRGVEDLATDRTVLYELQQLTNATIQVYLAETARRSDAAVRGKTGQDCGKSCGSPCRSLVTGVSDRHGPRGTA